MYQRFVYFKFKENTPREVVEQHMRMFAALRAAIPEIVDYTVGEALVGLEGHDKFDTAHCHLQDQRRH